MSERPLQAVLSAFEGGCATLDEVAERTGLTRDLVDMAVVQLRRIGRLDAKELSMGCPASGCGACASGKVDGTAGCGASGPSSVRRGPVLVQLSVRHAPG